MTYYFQDGEKEFLIGEAKTIIKIATEITGGFTVKHIGFDGSHDLYEIRGANDESTWFMEYDGYIPAMNFPIEIINLVA